MVRIDGAHDSRSIPQIDQHPNVSLRSPILYASRKHGRMVCDIERVRHFFYLHG